MPLLRLLRLHREDALGRCRNQMKSVPRPANWIEGFGQRDVSVSAGRDSPGSGRLRAALQWWTNDQAGEWSVCLKCRWIFDALYFLVTSFSSYEVGPATVLCCYSSDLGGTAEAGFDTAWPPSQRQHHWDLLARCLGCCSGPLVRYYLFNGSASCHLNLNKKRPTFRRNG